VLGLDVIGDGAGVEGLMAVLKLGLVCDVGAFVAVGDRCWNWGLGLLKLGALVGSGAGVEVAGWFGKWAQLEM
jgi:hypothetical protein